MEMTEFHSRTQTRRGSGVWTISKVEYKLDSDQSFLQKAMAPATTGTFGKWKQIFHLLNFKVDHKTSVAEPKLFTFGSGSPHFPLISAPPSAV